MDKDYPLPSEPVMDIILAVGNTLYDEGRLSFGLAYDFTPDPSITDQKLRDTVVTAMGAVLKRLPHGDAPFSVPVIQTSHAPSFIWDLIEPLRSVPAFKSTVDRFNVNMAVITEEQNAQTIKSKAVPRVTPQLYKGDNVGRYLDGTPLRPLLDILVPYQPFSELNRCAHHWCLGKTRRGKTTFLRHLIKYDLDEVAKERCSLVVIDSKTLIREMRTLKRFAAGEELDGRLILIDSDQAFPLNPFHLPKEQARAVLLYMLASMSDASQLQSGALGFYIDAALASDDKSFDTIIKYMRLPHNQLPDEIGDFDKQTAEWFKTTRKTLHSATSGGIEQRLANFLREHRRSPLMKMLTADSWGLDLYTELHQGGKVLLVDTDWQKNGPDGANLLGRLIIALLENLATRRMKNPDKPVWVYIDEASDYLTNDPHFKQILIKAAAAKVGTTVAYQYKGLVDKSIEDALENAEIHSNCVERGKVELTIEERPMTLPVKQLEFIDNEPQMGQDDYKKLREWLAFAYPYKTAPTKPALVRFDPSAVAE